METTPTCIATSGARGPIGIDLDNTIIDYTDLFIKVASERGYVTAGSARDKNTVRAAIRALPEGEDKWQQVQAIVYGPRINEARLIDGVVDFVTECRRRDIPLRIVSHKTVFAAADPGGVDMRVAARRWLDASGILEAGGLAPRDVYFEDTRAEKVRRIARLNCSWFIDDLDEVFLENGFATGTSGVLFDPGYAYAEGHIGLPVCRSWREISGYVFGRRG